MNREDKVVRGLPGQQKPIQWNSSNANILGAKFMSCVLISGVEEGVWSKLLTNQKCSYSLLEGVPCSTGERQS